MFVKVPSWFFIGFCFLQELAQTNNTMILPANANDVTGMVAQVS